MDLLTLAGLFQLHCAGFVLIILTMEGSGGVDGGISGTTTATAGLLFQSSQTSV